MPHPWHDRCESASGGIIGIRKWRSRKEQAAPAGPEQEPVLLLALPSSIVSGTSVESHLVRSYPSVPPKHLSVLVLYLSIGTHKAGVTLDTLDLRLALDGVCRQYERGALEVREVGNEWQVWKTGDLTLTE